MLDGCLSPALPRPLADDGSPLILEAIVDRAEELPPAPDVVAGLLDEFDQPAQNARQVAGLLERDPVLCARVLRACHASRYVVPEEVRDMRAAVGRLGIGGVQQLVLTSPRRRPAPLEGVVFDAIRSQLLTAAAATRVVAGYVEELPADVAFLCGAMRGVGRLVLAKASPLHYGELCELAALREEPIASLEEDWAGFTHVEVGAGWARRWGLPGIFEYVIEQAHRYPRTNGGVDPVWPLAAACAGLGAVLAAALSGEAPRQAASGAALADHPGQTLLRLPMGVLAGLYRECERARFEVG